MGEHSPGPWTYTGPEIVDANGQRVCGCCAHANGPLLAAAPALLASLKETRDAAAALMRAIHGSGYGHAVMALIDPQYNGFGTRADAAIRLATEGTNG